jgi:hypothetical protein
VWLEDYLSDGPRASKDVKEAAENEGIAERTLERAKKDVARSYKDGKVWMMELLSQERQECQVRQDSGECQAGIVERNDTLLMV